VSDVSAEKRLRELEAEVERLRKLLRELWNEWALVVEKLDELEESLVLLEGRVEKRCSG
jgi:predicted  nucleic acid-binding Zn-ribbon protein